METTIKAEVLSLTDYHALVKGGKFRPPRGVLKQKQKKVKPPSASQMRQARQASQQTIKDNMRANGRAFQNSPEGRQLARQAKQRKPRARMAGKLQLPVGGKKMPPKARKAMSAVQAQPGAAKKPPAYLPGVHNPNSPMRQKPRSMKRKSKKFKPNAADMLSKDVAGVRDWSMTSRKSLLKGLTIGDLVKVRS